MPKSLTKYADLSVASEAYASVTDARAGILAQCEIAYGYMVSVPEAEVSEGRKRLSIATMQALATRYGMPTEGPLFEEASKVPANRPGGIGVSTTAIKQRTNAYAHVIAAGLTPDVLNVTAAFRLHSITAEGHDKIVNRVTEAVLSDPESDFVELANMESDALTAARKAKREARGNSGGAKPQELSAKNVIDALKWASANLDKFSDEDKSDLADIMSQVSALVA